MACNKCKKIFTNFGIKRHEPKCNGKEKHICPKCGQTEKTAREIKKKHMHEEHEDHEEEEVREKSREVCWHWRQGNCFRGDSCNFSHVGYQKSTSTKDPSTRAQTCKNGHSCQWKQQGHCRYFHHGIGVQKPKNMQDVQRGRQGSGGIHGAHQQGTQHRQLCRWNEKCFRKDTCKFKHTNSGGFPQNSRNHHWPINRNLGNGMNQRRR